jgi:hypothetical protein
MGGGQLPLLDDAATTRLRVPRAYVIAHLPTHPAPPHLNIDTHSGEDAVGISSLGVFGIQSRLRNVP